MMEEDTLQNYTTPAHPTAFSGIGNVGKYYRLGPERTRHLLSRVYSYPIHRSYRRPKVRNPYFIYAKRSQLQIDLIDMQALAKQNDNYKYIICIIDTFTRKLWVRAVRSRHAQGVTAAVREILVTMDRLPDSILADRGTEMKNRYFQRMLADLNIRFDHPDSEVKAGSVERVNRSLQSLLYKSMTERESRRYIDVLQPLVETYNSRPHRSLQGMSPDEADLDANQDRVSSIQRERFAKILEERRPPRFRVGDTVRVKINFGNRFARGYEEQFSRELFRIRDINLRMPIPMYFLYSLDEEERIDGGFYGNEITLANIAEDEHRVEKILQQRRNSEGHLEYLVRWRGYGREHDSWIRATDITRRFEDNSSSSNE